MDKERYLHSINLYTDWVCNNLAIPSPINSVLALNQFSFRTKIDTPVYSCNVEDLYEHPERCWSGAGSPSFQTVTFAAVFRRGLELVNGFGQVMQFTDEQKRRQIKKADLEIDFEKERRMHYPDKPSRLSSLFIVEDSDEGRGCLYNIFKKFENEGRYRPHILDVKILVAMRRHKGDTRWLNQYEETEDRKCISQYWEGKRVDNQIEDEILLEGILLPTNRQQIEFIREEGTFFPGYNHKKYWQDLNSDQYNEWFV